MGVDLLIRVAIAMLCLAALAIPPGSAAAESQGTGFAGPRLAWDSRNATVAVGALDDPANPYRDLYTDYDRWLYEHYAPYIEEEVLKAFSGIVTEENRAIRERYPEGWSIRLASVDEQGWMLPAAGLRTEPQPLKDIAFGNVRPADERRSIWFSFRAAGVLPPELAELAEALSKLRYIKALPPIPAWLGEHPPLQTVFVPNGEIITYGPLDLRYEEEVGSSVHHMQIQEGEDWYRYDREGKLLAAYPGGLGHFAYWHAVYGTTHEDLALPEPRPTNSATAARGRYLMLLDSLGWLPRQPGEPLKPPTVLLALDYDGTAVELNQPATIAAIEATSPIEAAALRAYYKAQLTLGLTSADSASPYWGQPGGPVAVDPVPRPRPKRARRYEDGERFINIRPPEDPQNPYRSAYCGLEQWAYERAGRLGFQPAGPDAARRPNSEAYAAGQAAYFAQLQLYTDSAGFILPLDDLFMLPWELGLAPYPDMSAAPYAGAYSFSASGEMPAALWDEVCCRVWEMGLKDYPPLPDWLLAGGGSAAVFLPDGTVLAQPRALAQETPGMPDYEDRELALYSAEGQEIRRGTAKNIFSWPEFFDPAYAVKLDGAQRQGYTAYLHEGYLKVWPQGALPDSTPLAAYTYAGVPVDPESITPMPAGRCRVLQSHQLQRIYQIQRYMTTRAEAPRAD